MILIKIAFKTSLTFLLLISTLFILAPQSAAASVQPTSGLHESSYGGNLFIKSSTPVNKELNVITDKVIKINFNKPVKFKNNWIELRTGTSLVPLKRIIRNSSLILIPQKTLRSGSIYSAVLHTNSLTDFKGNGLSCFTLRFSTSAKIDIINHKTGGCIGKNSILTSYLPKTVLTYRILEASKIGTPMITFGDGNGPKVFMVAGVHGNELPAMAAAMKLINYLNGKVVKGTVYIVPFAIPICISDTTRYWHGVDPNDIANKHGSPTNVIIEKAKSLGVQALGDFHSTQPGGRPGKNSALCTLIPTFKSYLIASYIARRSGSTLIAERIAGKNYPGAVEDVTNLIGIPAVTCEVLIFPGKLNSTRIDKSVAQMFSFIQYNKIRIQ